MTTVQEIEKAVSDLTPKDLVRFRTWYEAFDAAEWDKQFEDDVKSGKLDKIAQKAIQDFKKGNFKEI